MKFNYASFRPGSPKINGSQFRCDAVVRVLQRLGTLGVVLAFIGMPTNADAAISFVGSAANSSSPNTATSVSVSGIGIAANDLIIVAAAVGDTANNGMAAPTQGGYSRVPGVAASLYGNLTADTNLDLYYKIADGTETAVSFAAVGGTNASNAAVVMVFRGVDTSSPFDTNANTVTGTGTSNANPPSHNWSGTSGGWTVIAASTGHTGGATATFTFPTGYTTDAKQRAHNDTTDVLLGVGYNSTPSDPEDPAAFTAANIGTAANNAWAAVTMSLTPAPNVPTVLTGAAGNVSPTSATLFGNIVDDGGVSITNYGFATSTSADFTGSVSTTSLGAGSTGAYSSTVLLNAADTTFFYRAYAVNSGGVGYGSTRSLFSGNTNIARVMRLFEGYIMKLFSGKIILNQR